MAVPDPLEDTLEVRSVGGCHGHDARLADVVDDVHVEAAQSRGDAGRERHQDATDAQELRQVGSVQRALRRRMARA